MSLTSVWGGVGEIGPPVATLCKAGGEKVTIRGAYGPDIATVQLRGLRPGRSYSFVPFQPPVSATVRVGETGSISMSNFYRGSTTDFLGPSQGLESQGEGTLSVAKDGQSGSLKVTLPHGDSIAGSWICGNSHATSTFNRPVLPPAKVPPVVNECSIGTEVTSPPPPVTCANGDLNVAQWFGGPSSVESAGPKATLSTVESDICRDMATFPLDGAFVEYLYSLSVVYYGWHIPMTPAQVLASANCTNSS